MAIEDSTDMLDSPRGRIAVGIVITAIFLGLRIALWLTRDLFYDELFTAWIARQPLASILEALRHDSGPPLYYFIVHLIPSPRGISFAASCITLALILGRRSLGAARFTAATLLAVFPPAVLLAVDGRAYALCALFVTMGILALDDDHPWLAAFAFVVAAYSHYYGVLFFPLLLRRRSAVMTLLFVPGLLLALGQPAEAMGWAGGGLRYPVALFAPVPVGLLVVAVALFLMAVGRDWRNRFALMTLVPVAGALVLVLAGRPVYIPLRFEAVIAPPLILWIATAVEAWSPRVRRLLIAAIVLVSAITTTLGIADHAHRPPDPYSVAASRIDVPVIASGYMFLEVAARRGDVQALPREQAVHPGWRANLRADVLRDQSASLPRQFVWTGERGAPELAILRERYIAKPLFVNESAIIARMVRR
jgi:hypothetical protein